MMNSKFLVTLFIILFVPCTIQFLFSGTADPRAGNDKLGSSHGKRGPAQGNAQQVSVMQMRIFEELLGGGELNS